MKKPPVHGANWLPIYPTTKNVCLVRLGRVSVVINDIRADHLFAYDTNPFLFFLWRVSYKKECIPCEVDSETVFLFCVIFSGFDSLARFELDGLGWLRFSDFLGFECI